LRGLRSGTTNLSGSDTWQQVEEGRSSDERPGYDSKEQSMLEQIGKLRQNEENAKKRSNAKTARSKSGMQE